MKRSGFTMIELIFVIVILGILAAVAIPKLAATRDDAKIAKGATEIASVVTDLGAYYTAQGAFSSDVTQMTNVKLVGTDILTEDLYYVANSANGNCIEINSTSAAAADGNFTVSYIGSGADETAVCQGIANAASKITGGVAGAGTGVTHSFGGSNVNWD